MSPIGTPLTAVWQYDDSASAYVDNTIEAQTDKGTAFSLLGEAADVHYFGFSRRIDALVFALSGAGTYSGLRWDYGASVSSWIQFVPQQEYTFNDTGGYMLWAPRDSAIDTAWASFALTTSNPHSSVSSVPDSVSRYWIRVSASTITTDTTVNSVICRPYCSYASPSDVQQQFQLQTAFSGSTAITDFRVEDLLRSAEDQLLYQMGLSWRPEFVEEEYIDFKPFGMKTRYDDVHMLELAVWDGNSFSVKVEGRDQDYFVDSVTGMIYIATIFLDAMPPQMRRSYSVRRSQGAFKRSVRLRYIYGRDLQRDPLGHQLRQICTKMACIDIATNLDFATLIPLGGDSIGLQEKVNNWSKDVEDFLDRYSKLRMA